MGEMTVETQFKLYKNGEQDGGSQTQGKAGHIGNQGNRITVEDPDQSCRGHVWFFWVSQ
jgi:hypothetical protein